MSDKIYKICAPQNIKAETWVDRAKKDLDGNELPAAYQKISEKGQPDGYASLDENGKVPANQITYAALAFSTRSAFPAKGDSNCVYIAKDTSIAYAWSDLLSAYLYASETSVETVASDLEKEKQRANVAEDTNGKLISALQAKIPNAPASAGEYRLTADVAADGFVSYSWKS